MTVFIDLFLYILIHIYIYRRLTAVRTAYIYITGICTYPRTWMERENANWSLELHSCRQTADSSEQIIWYQSPTQKVVANNLDSIQAEGSEQTCISSRHPCGATSAEGLITGRANPNSITHYRIPQKKVTSLSPATHPYYISQHHWLEEELFLWLHTSRTDHVEKERHLNTILTRPLWASSAWQHVC